MVMSLNKLISWLRMKLRAFLGIEALPTRAEIVTIMAEIEHLKREIREQQPETVKSQTFSEFVTTQLDWEMVQRLELAEMLRNPPKEEQ